MFCGKGLRRRVDLGRSDAFQDIPKRDKLLPFHKDGLFAIESCQNWLRRVPGRVVVELNQATRDSLQRSDRGNELALRSQEEDGIFFDLHVIGTNAGMADSSVKVELAWSIVSLACIYTARLFSMESSASSKHAVHSPSLLAAHTIACGTSPSFTASWSFSCRSTISLAVYTTLS
jgi:hypothetical protein